MIDHKWDIQFGRNLWFSVGLHIDHHDPSITLHLPGILIYMGYCKQPGFRVYKKTIFKVTQKCEKEIQGTQRDCSWEQG